ncbi:MAG: phosphoenolpyruvate carboxylase [Flavobacteriaceae bacterium]|nr:phosphoenolpyruvate carboxylase [Flavobacteriaceae bacterium]
MSILPKIARFNEYVLSKYQIYNSIFMNLPYDTTANTGVYLPLFHEVCREGFEKGKNPTEITEYFFKRYKNRPKEKERINTMFRFIQYIERQVVLFDAVEDAAFDVINNMDGLGTMRNLRATAFSSHKKEALKKHLQEFKIRPVLTAHPTQFYPGKVLGIITDLCEAIKQNDLKDIRRLMAQLGKTPFFKKVKPTPYDEAVSLIWYLDNVFYESIPEIFNFIQENIFDGEELNNEVINLGFWPGGDRDGNPFVTPEITLDVAETLRQTILNKYHQDIKKLKRRLTFKGVEDIVVRLEKRLYKHVKRSYKVVNFSDKILLEELYAIRELLISDHHSLYLEELDFFIQKVKLFGFYFASLDLRQDSRVHHAAFTKMVEELQAKNDTIFPENYLELSQGEQIEFLSTITGSVDPNDFSDEMLVKTLASMRAIKEIQYRNGERGCNRYIISNNQTALNVMQTYAMLKLSGFNEDLPVDVVPLFETVNDLENAQEVMGTLYSNEAYRNHLKERGNKQTIMLGFSDGTKDGGYLMANWSIFKAKEALTAISRANGIDVVFFDGRGGPPARGGGKTHKFYASLGPTIEDKEVQLTIQGQTISSNFGTKNSSKFNLEQLLSSGLTNEIFEPAPMSLAHTLLMEDLAQKSYQAYKGFKSHEKFIPYLERMSTLKYYAKTNIGSRPSKRSNSDKLNFSDLRAIPFVGSWSQLKQNVPGFFGVGTALQTYEDAGEFDKVIDFYRTSEFFKTLVENSVMSLTKSFFQLTAYMEHDEEFGAFWKLIHDEYKNTKRLLLKLTGHETLMENYPSGKASIKAREDIVLPLLTIQQYALKKIQDLNKAEKPNKKKIAVYEKMVTRSLFGNINASRNSA